MMIQPYAIPSLQVGGETFTDLNNLIVLTAQCIGAVNSTFRQGNGTAGYTPSGSLKFYPKVMTVHPIRGNSLSDTHIAYSDNDVGMKTATALTNPVYFCENSNMLFTTLIYTGPETANVQGRAYSLRGFVVPNGKYLTLKNDTAAAEGHFTIYGYEAA